MATITHAKTNTVSDPTQADLDAQIALGNYPSGTTLADITLPSDWNSDHTLMLGADENFVTDAQLAVIGNTSGTNTGDQTSIVGITGTKAQFDTACTDGNFLYVGDITQYTDEMAQDAVGGILVDSSEIDFTYNDATPSITASIVAGSIDETKLDASVNASLDLADSAAQNSFRTIAVSGQSDVVADSATDTLTLVAGSNITITTNAATDSITIAAAGGSGSPGGSDTQIQFNNAGSFGGAAALTYASSGTHLAATAQAATDKAVIVKGATSQTANLFEAQNSSGTAFLTIGAPTLAGDSATKNFINLTATMPTTMTAATYASRYDITTAGSSSFAVVGHLSTLVAGYTGSSTTIVGQFINNTSGTGATYAASSGSTDYRIASANYALAPSVSNTTTGTNVTIRALCNGSSTVNYAAWNSASSSNNTPALNVGTASFALNATTNCAGFFALADYGTSAPTFSNAALIADNGATTGDIFCARDNGTVKFKVTDGGDVTIANFTSAGVVRNNASGVLSSDANLLITQGSFYLQTGANITIPLISSARQAFTINSLHNLKTASGTITAAIQINGTNVTGLSALSVSSTASSPTASGANSVAVGDRVTLVLSSNASAADIEFTMKGTLA